MAKRIKGILDSVSEVLKNHPSATLLSTFIAIVAGCYVVYGILFLQPLEQDIHKLRNEITELKESNNQMRNAVLEKDRVIQGYIAEAGSMNRDYDVKTREYSQIRSEISQQREISMKQEYEHKVQMEGKDRAIRDLQEKMQPDTLYLKEGTLINIEGGRTAIQCQRIGVIDNKYYGMTIMITYRDGKQDQVYLNLREKVFRDHDNKRYHLSLPDPDIWRNGVESDYYSNRLRGGNPMILSMEELHR